MKGISAHLQRHPKSGILYFRLAVPRRLWAILGKRELKRSLRTARISEAVPLALAAYLAALKLFTQATRGAIMPKKTDPKTEQEYLKQLWDNAPWRWNRAASKESDSDSEAEPPATAPEGVSGQAAPSASSSTMPAASNAGQEAAQAAPRTESNTPQAGASLQGGRETLPPSAFGAASSDTPPDWKKLVIRPDGSMELDNPTPSELKAAKELHLTTAVSQSINRLRTK